MADYNANIRVSADTRKAEQQLRGIESQLETLNSLTNGVSRAFGAIGKSAPGFASKNLADYSKTLGQIDAQLGGFGKRLGDVAKAFDFGGKTVVGLSVLNGFGSALGAISQKAGGALGAFRDLGGAVATVTAPINTVTEALAQFGPDLLTATGGIAAATAALMAFGPALKQAVGKQAAGSVQQLALNFTALNTELNATQTSFAALIQNDALNKLVAQLRDAQQQVGEYKAFSDGSFTAVEQLLTVEKLVTREKRAQAALYNQLNSEARQLKSQVEQNVINSRNSRSGSGFSSFSAAASGIEGSTAIDKAIRRNYEKRIANAPAAPAAPLMLPSSEMLFSGNRRIERLTADPGLEAARAYTQELIKAAKTGSELDGIFTQVSKAMGATASGAAEGNRITQSWVKALREMATISADIAEATAKEAQLDKEAADARYLKLRALQTEEKIQAVLSRNAESARKRKAFGQQAESLALGVGFPLLFGGGPGSVGGAAIGSFVGTGFGGQILGGAIGQAIDQFGQAAAKTGNALRAPIENFKQLADAGLLASKGQEKYIQKLIEAGKTAEASALIQSQITNKIGVQGMKDLQNAGAASEKLNKAMAELGLQMQAAAAGPLAALTSGLAKFIATLNTYGSNAARVNDVRNGLGSADRAAFDKQNAQITDLTRRGLLFGGITPGEASNRQLQLANSFASRARITPASIPGATVESQQARATTQELQKQVDLGRANLALAGLTLEKDGSRYIAAAKYVALQELDNKLLEIKNSWIGKIFDKEQNLAMIRSANLQYQAKVQQINAQVAQKATSDANSQLQQELALYKVKEDILNFVIKQATVTGGEETGLVRRLQLQKSIEGVRVSMFDVEEKMALIEARKNGTLETTQRVYSARRTLLEQEAVLEDQITTEKINQLRTAEKINDAQKAYDSKQQLANIFSQIPMERSPMAQLQYEQAQRRGNTLNPLYQKQSALQQQLLGAGPGAADEEIRRLQKDLAGVNNDITQLTTALNYLDTQQTVWFKHSQGVKALEDVMTGVADVIANGIGSALTAVTQGTEDLGAALGNLAIDIMNTVSKMLIMYSIGAALKALAGGAADDKGGILTYLAAAFGHKAGGGPVSATRPYLVGERGPELFVPNTGGTVVPNGDLRAAMNNGGGASGGGTVLNMSFETSTINGVEYVSRDQLEAAMAQTRREAARDGAKRGMTMTLDRIQQSPQTRSRLGLR